MNRILKLPITFACLFSLLLIGCELLDENENAVHQELSSLLIELESATTSGQTESLQAVISKAERVKPYSAYQTDTKNYILSTAQGSLAQAQFVELQSRANRISSLFRIASEQAQQTLLLQTLADAKTANNSNNENIIPATEETYKRKQVEFQQSLSGLMSAVDALDDQATQSQRKADDYRRDADSLFDTASSKGIVEGHSDFKDGVKVIRSAHKEQLEANEFQLQQRMVATPALENRRAEIEAVASILNGIEHSKEILAEMKSAATTNASKIRDTATEFDHTTATTLQTALERSEALMTEWDASIALMQKALQKSSRARSAPRDMQAASEAWKFDMELSLGMAEEARRRFLIDQANAVQSMINNNIATSSTKWSAMASSTKDAIDHATSAAIASYENAKLVAPSGNNSSINLTQGIDARIAHLHGAPAVIETVPVANSTNTSSSTAMTSGFDSPAALIEAMNAFPQLGTEEAMQSSVQLANFYVAHNAEGQSLVDFLSGLYSSTNALLLAVRNNFGEEAYTEMVRQQGAGGFEFKGDFDPSSLSVSGDRATVNDTQGRTKTLERTTSGWKIVADTTSDDAQVVLMMVEMLGPMVDVMNQAAEQVNSGAISSMDELQAMMMSASDPF